MGTWKIDPAHTDVSFSAKHMMITTVKGRLSALHGRELAEFTGGANARLDEPDGQPELGGADGAHVAHASAEDEEVEVLLVGHATPCAARSSERPSAASSRSRQSSGTGIGRAAA